LGEECRLRVFQNGVLRGLFGLKRGEVTGEWRKLYNEELNIIWLLKQRRMGWVGHIACMGERRGAYRFLVGKPEGKRLLGRPRHRCKDNIKMDLREVGCWVMERIKLAQDGQVAGTCRCSNEPLVYMKCGEFLDWLRTG